MSARTRVVWKYVLPISDVVEVAINDLAYPLSVQEQGGDLCLWALVDPTEPLVTRRFLIHGTGHPVGAVGRYIGTAQTHLGALVWHVFEAPTSASDGPSSDAPKGKEAQA